MTEDLLTIDDIAKLYRVTRRYARDFLVKNPRFPKPIPLSTRKKPLWHRETIEAFVRDSRPDYAQAA
jgi:hypothetical protein